MTVERDWTRGLRRGADALARAVGCTTVRLQMPALPVAGDDGEELGLRAPEFQVRLLGPVAVRQLAKGAEVLAPADTLEDALGVAGEGAVRTAMQSVSAVLVSDVSFGLAEVQVVLDAGGEACLYRLLLQGEGIEVT